MIRFSITILFIVLTRILCVAQENMLELDLGIISKNEFLHESSFIDLVSSSRQFFLTLPCKDKVHFYLFDSNWKILQNFTETRVDSANSNDSSNSDSKQSDNKYFFKKSYVPSGTINAGQNKLICAYAKSDEAIYFETIDFSAQSTSPSGLWRASKNEKLIFCFPYIDHLFWVTTNKKSPDVVKIYRFDSVGEMDTSSISLDNYFTDEVPPSMHYWNHNVSLLLPERISTLLNTSQRGKLYLQNGSLVIASDENIDYTDVSSVDLASFKQSHYIVRYISSEQLTQGVDNHNSFLLDDILLQANVHKGVFTFSISNIKDTTQKKIFSFDKSDEILFKNSAVVQIGTSFSPTAEKELFKTQQFIRKVDSKGLALFAETRENGIQAQIGSSESASVGGGGGVYMPGGTMSTPGGAISMPGSWTSFSGSGYKNTKTVFFYSIFDPITFEHLPKKVPVVNKIKELGDFVDENNRHLKEPIRIDKMIITGYLNTDSKKFMLVRF